MKTKLVEPLEKSLLEQLLERIGNPKTLLLKTSLKKLSDQKLDQRDLEFLDKNVREFYDQWKKLIDNTANPGGICISCFTILKKGKKVYIIFIIIF